ncbi:hypothetical protein J2T02_002632 [Chitinophaga terrae (ex Kim and Jung 2007)]|uniref:hypothetical protein n=1 Tax=Chitinophaga terrae (ex Kim and Jung 2007) TaxID=408074 RepID=UPI0027805B02|nr:hypothetical protein [Chitinophaga terrae (ex Kim and Jung 2007)]MDQ0107513.1 hypothetical protein [Chitinophaga terrae (ex Kim and Jung 2007)]
MKAYKPRDIIALTLEEIAGCITPENNQKLKEAIATDSGALKIYQQLHEKFPPAVVEAICANTPPFEQIFRMAERWRKRKKLTAFIRKKRNGWRLRYPYCPIIRYTLRR